MENSKVSSTAAPLSIPRPEERERGYVERAVRSVTDPIFFLFRSPPPPPLPVPLPEPKKEEFSFERSLLDNLKRKTLCPTVLLRQFHQFVPRDEQKRLFEELGRGKPLSYKDRVWNWIWRDESAVRKRYREIGCLEARRNPYLLGDSLEKSLSKKIFTHT